MGSRSRSCCPRTDLAKSADWAADYPGFDIRVTGPVFGGLTLSQAAKDDVVTLVPIAFVVAIAILAFFLRSPRAVLACTAVVGLGTVATFGIAGWMGIELTAGTAISPLAVMVLTSASCVHIVLAWTRALETGTAQEATAQALSLNLAPVTVATVTTSVGFLGLNFADSPPLRDMGRVVSLGLLFAMGLVFVLLPFALRRSGLAHARRRLPLSREGMERFARWVWRTQMLWLVLFPAGLAVSAFGIHRIGFDDNLLRYFSDHYEFRRDTDAIQDRLAGMDSLQFSFTAPEGATVFDPDFLRDIDRFAAWLETQEVVVSTLAITDIVKRMNRSMSGDDPEAFRVADTPEANAQLMMFYELSLPEGLDLNTQIDVDRTRTRVVAFLRAGHSDDIRDLALAAEAWMADNTPETVATAGGYSVAFSRITERNNRQMLLGLVLVLALVSLILMATMRNFRFGLISLVPNLVPAILAFGFWGVTFRDVNLGSTVVTTMTFGIVVDDSVHFLMHYLRRRREGLAPQAALERTFASVGAAILITSIALIAGFAIMATSGFTINQHMGALTAIVIVFALLADLLLLPSVIRLFERKS
ncbi:MAG: MMPL family transporter [Proteobacteria bacterium]|nr:MMPL family transporter [Pseudomonadota bacterium]